MEALSLGIETIYQDLALAENLNVYSNIFLGREKTRRAMGLFPVLDHQYMYDESHAILKKLDIKIPSLRNTVRSLSGGQRQAVAISGPSTGTRNALSWTNRPRPWESLSSIRFLSW